MSELSGSQELSNHVRARDQLQTLVGLNTSVTNRCRSVLTELSAVHQRFEERQQRVAAEGAFGAQSLPVSPTVPAWGSPGAPVQNFAAQSLPSSPSPWGSQLPPTRSRAAEVARLRQEYNAAQSSAGSFPSTHALQQDQAELLAQALSARRVDALEHEIGDAMKHAEKGAENAHSILHSAGAALGGLPKGGPDHLNSMVRELAALRQHFERGGEVIAPSFQNGTSPGSNALLHPPSAPGPAQLLSRLDPSISRPCSAPTLWPLNAFPDPPITVTPGHPSSSAPSTPWPSLPLSPGDIGSHEMGTRLGEDSGAALSAIPSPRPQDYRDNADVPVLRSPYRTLGDVYDREELAAEKAFRSQPQELEVLRAELRESQQKALALEKQVDLMTTASFEKNHGESLLRQRVHDELEDVQSQLFMSEQNHVASQRAGLEESVRATQELAAFEKKEQREAMRFHFTMLQAEHDIQRLGDENKAASKRLKKTEKDSAAMRQCEDALEKQAERQQQQLMQMERGEQAAIYESAEMQLQLDTCEEQVRLAAEELAAQEVRSETLSMEDLLEQSTEIERAALERAAALQLQLDESEGRQRLENEKNAAVISALRHLGSSTEQELFDAEERAVKEAARWELIAEASAESSKELEDLRLEVAELQEQCKANDRKTEYLNLEERPSEFESSTSAGLLMTSPPLTLEFGTNGKEPSNGRFHAVIQGRSPEALGHAIHVAERNGVSGAFVEEAKAKFAKLNQASLWSYEPATFERLALYELPDLRSPPSGFSLVPGDVFQVYEKREAGGDAHFLHLADGSGWALDTDPKLKIKTCVPHTSLMVTCSMDGQARLWDYEGGLNEEEIKKAAVAAPKAKADPKARARVGAAAKPKLAPKAKAKAEEQHLADLGPAKPTVPTGKQLRSFLHNGRVQCGFAMGRQLATGSGDHCAQTWDLQSGAEICKFHHPDVVWSVWMFGRYLVTGSADHFARLWDMDSGEQLRKFHHDGEVRSACLEGHKLLTGSADTFARVWNIPIDTFGNMSKEIRLPHDGWVLSVCFAAQHVITGCADRFARLWDVSNGTGEERHKFAHDAEVNVVAANKTGTQFVTGSDDTWARLFSLSNNELLQRFKHDGPVVGICLAGNELIVTAASDKFARAWDIKTGEIVRQFQHPDIVRGVFAIENVIDAPEGLTTPASSVVFSPM